MSKRIVLFENKKWLYDTEGKWHIYSNRISNVQLWRIDGKCLEVRRKGVNFNIFDIKVLGDFDWKYKFD